MCKSRAANTELLAGGVGQGKGEMENETGTGWGDDTAVSTARADGGGLQKPHLICWSCQVALAALHPEQCARPPRCSPPFRGLLGQSARGLSLQSADTTAGERQHSENSLQQGVRAVSMSPWALLWHMGHRRIHRSALSCTFLPRDTEPRVAPARSLARGHPGRARIRGWGWKDGAWFASEMRRLWGGWGSLHLKQLWGSLFPSARHSTKRLRLLLPPCRVPRMAPGCPRAPKASTPPSQSHLPGSDQHPRPTHDTERRERLSQQHPCPSQPPNSSFHPQTASSRGHRRLPLHQHAGDVWHAGSQAGKGWLQPAPRHCLNIYHRSGSW